MSATEIAVLSPSPLLGQALVSSLGAVPGWRVSLVDREAVQVEAGAVVWHRTGAVAAPPGSPAGLQPEVPAETPLVLLDDFGFDPPPRDPSWLGHHAAPLAWLPASATPAQVVAAVGAVLQGLSVRSGPWPVASPAQSPAPADHEPLTPRELEVFELIGKGLSNRDIAGVLGISAHTAKFHVAQILAKVGAATRAEAVSLGLRLGVIGV